MVTDPIADMLTRIRNANQMRYKEVEVPASKMKLEIVEILKNEGYIADLFVFEAGEKQKTRQTKEYVEDKMLELGYRRDCCIIAVGGGVVTDLAGFVAGTFGRGVPFINYATTLLAAADASVGGKTAVDTPLATNLIGLFNQPEKVYLDIATWKTLPEEKEQFTMALADAGIRWEAMEVLELWG